MTALSVAVVYTPITGLSFSGPDDHWMLLKNEYVHPAAYSREYFKEIFLRINNVQYSPLNTFYYSLIYRINGFDPYYFHLANVCIHLTNTALVYLLCLELLKAFRVEGEYYIALLTCFLWGINTVNVEPVAWISGSKILLCTNLTLCAFWLFVKGVLQRRYLYLLLSFIAFFISFFFKEQGIITPVLLSFFIFFYNCSGRGSIPLKGPVFFTLGLFFLSSVLFGLHSLRINYDQASIIPPIHNYPLYQKVLITSYCFSFYFYSVIFPFNLHYHYLFPFEPYGKVPFLVYISLPATGLTIWFYYWCIKRSADLYLYLFLFCLFFCGIFLELQVIPMTRPAVMGDRFMYFPAIPLLLTVAKLLYDFFRDKKGASAYVAGFMLAFFIISMMIRTNNMVQYWNHFNLIK